MATPRKTTRSRLRDVVAEGELRPEPDWDKYAWALLQYVKLRREQREQVEARQRSVSEQDR